VNTTLLIEALVQQTTVLIATLATAAGERTPLSRVADQVFSNLVAELKAQGIGSKVIADMFGMALRTYHYRMARVAESATERGRSVWEAVLAHVQASDFVLRADVLQRFQRDDPEVVRSVLRDLVDARLLFRTGRGDQTGYRATSDEPEPSDHDGAVRQLLLVALHRHGSLSRDDLARHVPVAERVLDALLDRLVRDDQVRTHEVQGEIRYECDSVLVHYGDAEGWQAALFDHYQAMVIAMCTKLQRGRTHATAGDHIGGSTYHFDIWAGHPLEHEVLGLLSELRARSLELCERVQATNARLPREPHGASRRVSAYVGQTVIEDEMRSDDDGDD
jgi:predicted MarR family transcription regulator